MRASPRSGQSPCARIHRTICQEPHFTCCPWGEVDVAYASDKSAVSSTSHSRHRHSRETHPQTLDSVGRNCRSEWRDTRAPKPHACMHVGLPYRPGPLYRIVDVCDVPDPSPVHAKVFRPSRKYSPCVMVSATSVCRIAPYANERAVPRC
jgi:hypothetical protein